MLSISERIKKIDSYSLIRVSLLFLIFFVPFFILYVLFYYPVATEMPFQTWIDMFEITTPFYNGTLSYSDLFSRYGECGMFGYNLLLLLNITCFGGTVYFDFAICCIVTILISIMFFYCFYHYNKNINLFILIISSFLISFVSFMLSQSFSNAMETQVRITPLFFIPFALVFSKGLNDNKNTWYFYVIYSLLCLLLINVFGTMYSVAILPVVLIIYIVHSIKAKHVSLKSTLMVGILVACVILYFFEYGYISKGLSDSSGVSLWDNMLRILTNIGDDFLALFAYFGSPLLSYNVYVLNTVGVTDQTYLIVGGIFCFFLVGSIVLFIVTKQYKKTYIPIILIGYSFFVFCFVLIGRAGTWQWMLNEWYAVNVKYAYLGVIWIYASSIGSLSFDFKKLGLSACTILLGVALVTPISFATSSYYGFQPYLESYYKNIQGYCLITDRDEMPVDDSGLTPLLKSLDKTMNTLETLKSHQLSIYRPGYINYSTNYDDNNVSLGLYDYESAGSKSRFIQQYSLVPMNSGNGIFDFEGYMPENGIYDDNEVHIYFNDNLIGNWAITETYNHFAVYIGEENTDGIIKIKIKNPIVSPDDQRNLGIMVINMNFGEVS